jgi:heme oxygenase
MQRLKDGTRDCHNNAESQEFQRLLASAELPKKLYVNYIEQLWLIHKRLEEHLAALAKKDAAVAETVTESQMQVPFLQQDLEFFGADTERIHATPATKWLLERIDEKAQQGTAVLGSHYVLLGSKHGGKYIAHSLQSKFQLTEGKGAVYFDPYGPTFMQIWKSFANGMNELPLSEDDENTMITAAREMFEGVGRLSEEMVQAKV